jgi:peptidyl-dipeptidase Dcp
MISLFRKFVTAFTISSMIISQANGQTIKRPADNPLLQKSDLQYQAPRFDLIKDFHFKPAFDYALFMHDKEIEDITNNPDKPTFQNTVVAIEISGENLNRATGIFYN